MVVVWGGMEVVEWCGPQICMPEQTKTLEFAAEKGLLQGQARRKSSSCSKSLNWQMVFREEFLEATLVGESYKVCDFLWLVSGALTGQCSRDLCHPSSDSSRPGVSMLVLSLKWLSSAWVGGLSSCPETWRSQSDCYGSFLSRSIYCPIVSWLSSCFPSLLAQSVGLFVTPWTVARQAPLSMEILQTNTGAGCHAFLPRIFPTHGSDQGLLHCRKILYPPSHQGSPWVGSLSLPQMIFLTQESSPDLLHCRLILYLLP